MTERWEIYVQILSGVALGGLFLWWLERPFDKIYKQNGARAPFYKFNMLWMFFVGLVYPFGWDYNFINGFYLGMLIAPIGSFPWPWPKWVPPPRGQGAVIAVLCAAPMGAGLGLMLLLRHFLQ